MGRYLKLNLYSPLFNRADTTRRMAGYVKSHFRKVVTRKVGHLHSTDSGVLSWLVNIASIIFQADKYG